MHVLGLNFYHNDSSVALIKDGKIINAITEERLNRRKHSSAFPVLAIHEILEFNNLSLNEIDFITLNTNPKITLKKVIYVLKNLISKDLFINSFKRYQGKKNLNKIFLEHFNQDLSSKIIYVDHHLSHINSGFLISPFHECLSLSIDGFGDFKSSSYGISKNNNTKIYGNIFFPHSLGIFYQSMTQFIGFKKYGDEYKLMGLSAYGENKFEDKLLNLVDYKNLYYKLNLDYFRHQNENLQTHDSNGDIIYNDLYLKEKLEDLTKIKSQTKFEYSKDVADFSKSVQIVYERIFFEYLNDLQKKFDQKNLCLTGGCALNSLANGKILDRTKFENIFIPYEPSDAGGSIGSALTCYYNKNPNKKKFFQPNPYLGIEYSDEKIEKDLLIETNNKKISFKKFSNFQELCDEVVDLISDQNIISWFQSRMEFGPRALGNRSIIMDPRNRDAKEILNLKVKFRESYRPFAPSILIDETLNWFEKDNSANYMTFVYKIIDTKKEIIPAVCHVDGTGRLQTVDKNQNPKFYQLIETFFKKTNVPILINTSFNENEPIVNSPLDAVKTFLKTNLDILVINNYLIRK